MSQDRPGAIQAPPEALENPSNGLNPFLRTGYPSLCPHCGAPGLVPLVWPAGKHIDLRTGIAPLSEWGVACYQGFVSDSRFGSAPVIKRTNRETTRKWRRSGASTTTGGDK